MNRFEEGIFGLIKKQDWLQVGFDVTRPNDPVDQMFGDVKTDNLIAYWESIAAEYGIPVMAMFHAFDVEAQKAIRVPVDVHNIEKGLIKVKIDQSERLRALMDRGVTNEETLYERVLRDGYNLADAVFTRSKVAKNEVLYSGKTTIKENGLDLTVDYGVPSGNLNKVIDFGAGASAPVADQLQELVETAILAGKPINGLYTSSTNLNRLRKDASIQKAINGANMVGMLVRNADLEAYLESEFGIRRVLTNDLTYSLPYTMGENGRPVASVQRYYPVSKMSFFHADAKIGDGLWGDPPEVTAEKYMNAALNTEESEVSPFVYVSQKAEFDPAVTWTKASALFMPVLYDPNALYVATATATPGA